MTKKTNYHKTQIVGTTSSEEETHPEIETHFHKIYHEEELYARLQMSSLSNTTIFLCLWEHIPPLIKTVCVSKGREEH